MGLDPNSRARFNLKDASVLLLDETQLGMTILVQIVTGLGAKNLHRCGDIESARSAVENNQIDLAIVDSLAATGQGYDFVEWLRRDAGEPNCYTPVLMTTSHTPRSQISRARDCGANIIIKKPFPPITVLERIIWSSKEGRKFLFSDTYVGPDRRFRNVGPPKGEKGRRREDFTATPLPQGQATADEDASADIEGGPELSGD
ncbi:MAG TPA: response regulator [Phenylobacterium sp.]|uniref:response regulator n=1 Tax=Phenylobacterium sp. TaxID=1871053 RepID=UPI002B4A23FD|nr:response regulator [Phenylobacterium sp.]HKR89819.1 response regulator [Phenylobacterium sp.]